MPEILVLFFNELKIIYSCSAYKKFWVQFSVVFVYNIVNDGLIFEEDPVLAFP